VRVAIADDSALFREGLSMLLTAAGVTVVAEARTAPELLAHLRRAQVDVAILDIRMPPTFTDEGLVCADRVRQLHPDVGVLVLSTYTQATYAVQLLARGHGGVGYLLKDRVDDVSGLLDALTRITAGESVIDPLIVQGLLARRRTVPVLTALTDRERQVLALMAEGRSNAGIGRALHLGAKTVEGHVGSIFRHLDLPGGDDQNRRVLAVLTFLRAGDATSLH